jgi:hypothetical protein
MASQLFTCFFALLGIAIIGYALQILGQQFVQAQVTAMQTAAAEAKPPDMEEDLSDPNRLLDTDTDEEREKKLIARAIKDDDAKRMKLDLQKKERTGKILKTFVPVIVCLVIGAIVYGFLEGWSPVEAM